MTWVPGKDRGWRREAAPKIVDLAEGYRTWSHQYHDHLEGIVDFVVARIEGCMAAMRESDCIVYFEKVPLHNITITNPERVEKSTKGYPQLQQILEYGREIDSVPVVLRRIGGQFAVWDGHHRLFTYQNARRSQIPAIVAWFVPGTGKVKVIDAVRARVSKADASAQEKQDPEPGSSSQDA